MVTGAGQSSLFVVADAVEHLVFEITLTTP
ncbi:Uncharacterised protein [Mycobacterium tuberculosis]|nr:Uncharacterised protein [Mycobacterium tuberculosis]